MAPETTFYFHGAPGSPAELALFQPGAAGMLARDRFVDRPQMAFDAYLDTLSEELEAEAAGTSMRLIGFSVGARVALEIARRLQRSTRRVELISPAAPLELGDFLPRMEGRMVFRFARHAPHLLPVLTWVQARMADHYPHRLLDVVFADPAGADAALAADPGFTAALTQILRQALGVGSLGYRREILAYVRPWGSVLTHVSAPVRIWQGAVDNWTPPDMGQVLHAALPNAEPMRRLDGLSHYSTLRLALAEIAAGR